MHPDRWRWWICRVDEAKRVYRYIADVPKYVDACLFADVAVSMLGGRFVVYDSHERKVTPYSCTPQR